MTKYPTPEEIMKTKIKINPATIIYTRAWKKILWKTPNKTPDETKFVALKTLGFNLAQIENKPLKNITWNQKLDTCCYKHKTKTIHMNQVSIISLLHELAHHLYGHSELIACRWSIQLFQTTFPEAFKKLKWKGHMLVKSN